MIFEVGDRVRVLPPEATDPPNPIAELSKNRTGQVVATYAPESQPYPYDVELDDGGAQLCFAGGELELIERPPADRPPAAVEAAVGAPTSRRSPGERLLRETAGLPHVPAPPKDQALMQAAVTTPPTDHVNRPDHYTSHPSGIECIQVTQHLDFLLGNVVKYLWRYGLKPDTPSLQDLKKARWYLDHKIALEEQRNG
ncbi:hypothetical protein GCM10010218_19530 [Streptomyces mashuensis]|uniref:DUF3310 domain-containing protein n=1 Tax=Streptomyces mashuensis TaxID=33904 RepID=A0A919B211_9ACTN|nr:DUF3310 domain-containing protein [Streptomyces mashuensis]GHF38484.1 hypothetical protein GCM10010218_19530 [Streptomyces mashuensis]